MMLMIQSDMIIYSTGLHHKVYKDQKYQLKTDFLKILTLKLFSDMFDIYIYIYKNVHLFFLIEQ